MILTTNGRRFEKMDLDEGGEKDEGDRNRPAD